MPARLERVLFTVLFLVLVVVIERSRDGVVQAPLEPLPVFSPADPVVSSPEADLRDPFVTGAQWRAERREAPPAPSPSVGASPVTTVPAPPSPPALLGTLMKGGRRFAVTEEAIVDAGARLGAFVVRSVAVDHVILEYHGRTIRVDALPGRLAPTAPPSPAGNR